MNALNRIKYLLAEGFFIGNIFSWQEPCQEGDEWKREGLFVIINYDQQPDGAWRQDCIPYSDEGEYLACLKLIPARPLKDTKYK